MAARPLNQLHWTSSDDPDVSIVGDRTGALKKWFDAQTDSVLFLRPDRCIAASCVAQLAAERSDALFDALTLNPGGGEFPRADRSVLYVPQPAAESTGTIG